jgi:hypothetical protein
VYFPSFRDRGLLSGDVLAFYDELIEMLSQVAPSSVDPESTEASIKDHVLMLAIPHRAESDLSIEVSASEKEIIVGTLADHHHFDARGWEDHSPGGPHIRAHWYAYATGYVADVLRGRLQIETTSKGRFPVHSKVTHFDEQGQQLGTCHWGIPFVWRLVFFKSTRRETRSPNFME